MKIAAVSDDGKTISMHFGRARQYVVVTVEDGRIVGREVREKVFHHHGPDGHDHHAHDHHQHGPHAQMAATIDDCQVLLAGGMGTPAYQSLKSHGIEPIITEVTEIDAAVSAYVGGSLRNLTERLH